MSSALEMPFNGKNSQATFRTRVRRLTAIACYQKCPFILKKTIVPTATTRANEDRLAEEGNSARLQRTRATLWCNRSGHDVTGEKVMTTNKTDRVKAGRATIKALRA